MFSRKTLFHTHRSRPALLHARCTRARVRLGRSLLLVFRWLLNDTSMNRPPCAARAPPQKAAAARASTTAPQQMDFTPCVRVVAAPATHTLQRAQRRARREEE
jgi:hypothetical protein